MASADFNTPDRIIRFAMKDAELLAAGVDPTPEQYAEHMNRLNDLMNLWQTQGLKLWLNSILPVTLTAGVNPYTLVGAPKRVLEAYYVDNTSTSRPLIPMSWNDYNTMSNKGQQGAVNSYFIDKQVASTIMSLWLVPDAQAATGTVQALVQNPVGNVANLTDTMNFPNEWFMALHWGLASEICTGQPQEIISRCDAKAEMYRGMLEAWNVEDAPTMFAPGIQVGRASRFR